MSYFVARIGKIKSAKLLEVAINHNVRNFISKRSNIDTSRTHLNKSFGFDGSAKEKVDFCEKLIKDAGIKKIRRNVVYAVELVVSLDSWDLDHDGFFSDLLKWAESYYQVPIISWDTHYDESKPHCHILMLPLINGRMNGSDLVGNIEHLNLMRKSIESSVARHYGIRLMSSEKSIKLKRSMANKVLKKLNGDPVKESSIWILIESLIYKSPEQFKVVLENGGSAKSV